MNFDTIIDDFFRSHGISSTSFDEKGILHFLINDTLAISLEKTLDGEGFFVYTILGKIPAGRELTFAMAVLEGNLFGKETNRSSIGYDPLTHHLVLFRYFNGMHLDIHSLSKGIEEFLEVYAHWIAKLNNLP